MRTAEPDIAFLLNTCSINTAPTPSPCAMGSTPTRSSEPDKPKPANIASNPRVALHLVGDEDAEDIVTAAAY